MIKWLKTLWHEKLCFWLYRDCYDYEFKWYSNFTYWIWEMSWPAALSLYMLLRRKRFCQAVQSTLFFEYNKLSHPIVYLWRFLWRVLLPIVGPFIFVCAVGRAFFRWDGKFPVIRWKSPADEILRTTLMEHGLMFKGDLNSEIIEIHPDAYRIRELYIRSISDTKTL